MGVRFSLSSLERSQNLIQNVEHAFQICHIISFVPIVDAELVIGYDGSVLIYTAMRALKKVWSC